MLIISSNIEKIRYTRRKCDMGTLTHKAARAAYGTAIDAVLKHVKKDREKGLL